ncbi:B3 domain-containing protein REM1-like [Salvia divinorum]|uniref:B3 domain-containing protein REM1-like n=1 Tax=Salvia divinorum TaxID=28513 RepID=A0ABD1HYG3_SALDI
MEELRLPSKWVGIHGGDLPFECRLVMPNGKGWTVRILRIASGCHFCVGWLEFRRDNRIAHGDNLTFTLVDVGTFQVKRYSMGTGCPPRTDIEMVEDEEADEVYSLDIDTSDDYKSSETEIDTSDDADYIEDRDALNTDGYPTFMVKLTRSNLNRTLEIPFGF